MHRHYTDKRDNGVDDSDSDDDVKKAVAIAAHRRGVCPSDESNEEIINP